MAESNPDTDATSAGIGTAAPHDVPASTPGVTMPIEFIRDAQNHIIKDRRYAVRSERQKAKRKRLIAEKEERERKENAVMAIAAGGAGWEFVARQLGISVRYARDLYARGMERVGKESTAEFVAAMEHRHAVLLQAHFGSALSPTDVDQTNLSLKIMDQWTKLRGAYPSSQVDLVGDVTVRREVSIREAMRIAAEIQADRMLAGEIPMPEFIDADLVEQPALNNTLLLNGHDAPE